MLLDLNGLRWHKRGNEFSTRAGGCMLGAATGIEITDAFVPNRSRRLARIQNALRVYNEGRFRDLSLDPQNGSQVAVVTGADFTRFDGAKHVRTQTKSYFSSKDSRTYLANCSAAVALQLVEANIRIVVHAQSKQASTLLSGYADE